MSNQKKSGCESASRGKHLKTKVTPTIVQFRTKDGKTIQVKGVTTKKVDQKHKRKK